MALAPIPNAGLSSGMTSLPFVPSEDPVLRGIAMRVDDVRLHEARWLAQDLLDSLKSAPGVGVAAPQLGIPMRAIAIHIPRTRVSGHEFDIPVEPQVLFNPSYEPIGRETAFGWEGCLSLPGIKVRVRRWQHIRYNALLADGRVVAREVSGFHARVIQHELDHLTGVLITDHAEMPKADIVNMNDLAKIVANDDLASARLDIAKAGEL